MRKLFGTDGIRGVAGEYPLDKKTVYAIGRALGDHLPAGPRRVVIGQDTRESSAWMADTLISGLRDSGVETASAGVVPTPAVAYLAHTHGFSAGVVISASHNPWRDNGIKVFGGDGYKLPDEIELEIETEIFALLKEEIAPKSDPAAAASLPLLLLDLYLESSGDEYCLASAAVRPRVAFGPACAMVIALLGANQANAFIYFQF